jgi:hypothetical protein
MDVKMVIRIALPYLIGNFIMPRIKIKDIYLYPVFVGLEIVYFSLLFYYYLQTKKQSEEKDITVKKKKWNPLNLIAEIFLNQPRFLFFILFTKKNLTSVPPETILQSIREYDTGIVKSMLRGRLINLALLTVFGILMKKRSMILFHCIFMPIEVFQGKMFKIYILRKTNITRPFDDDDGLENLLRKQIGLIFFFL